MAKYQDWLTPKGLAKIEEWARKGLIDEQIAENMGIARSTLSEWKKEFSDISNALKKSKAVVDQHVENALLKRALGYSYEEITKERIMDTGQKARHKGQQQRLTEDEWQACIQYFNGKCCYCGEQEELTKDHVVPLDSGGLLCKENVVPCCRRCNSSKSNHDMAQWYKGQKFYNAEKLINILMYLRNMGMGVSNSDMGELKTTKIVTKEVVPDTTAQIFWLKNRKPKEWRDKQNIELSGSVELTADDKREIMKKRLEELRVQN